MAIVEVDVMRLVPDVLVRSGFCAVVVCASLGVLAQTQATPPPAARGSAQAAPPAGTGTISGSVIAAANGGPVRKAEVTLSWGDKKAARTAVTDVLGHFAFIELPAADYTLTATHPGYLDVTYGQRQPGSGGSGTPIHLADRQRVSVSLRLPPEGALNGVVTDENGDPAFDIEVTAMRVVTTDNTRTLMPAGNAKTDDRGIYRIPSLPPGAYIVGAAPPRPAPADAIVGSANAATSTAVTQRDEPVLVNALAGLGPGQSGGHAPVYYPGTPYGSRAIEIPLNVSEERTGIDIQLQIVPAFPIWGTLTEPTGRIPAGAIVTLIEPGLGGRSTTSTPDGNFLFTDVAPGAYTVTARYTASTKNPRETTAPTTVLWGTAPVDIDVRMAGALHEYELVKATTRSDFSDEMVALRQRLGLPTTTIQLRDGLSVSGTMAFQPVPPPTADSLRPINPQTFSVLITNTEGAEMMTRRFADVDATGRFSIDGLVPGRYRVFAAPAPSGGPSGWTLVSAMANGRDALDFGLEILPDAGATWMTLTFTDRLTEVTGTAVDTAGKPVAGSTVVVFSANQQYWIPESRRTQTVRTSPDGLFVIRGLPAGSYRLAATAEMESGALHDPAVLQLLWTKSIAVTLADGDRKVQELRVLK